MENYFRNEIVQDVVTDPKKRTMTFVISDESVNRYGHKVMLAGWKYNKKYLPMLANHESYGVNGLPYAKLIKVWKKNATGQLMGVGEFPEEGVLPVSDLLWKLYDGGFMKAFSAGYIVDYSKTVYPKDQKGITAIFNSQELIEVSFATLPANPNALRQQSYITNALEAGAITEEEIGCLDPLCIDKEDDVILTTKSIKPEPKQEEDKIEDDPVEDEEEKDTYDWFFETYDGGIQEVKHKVEG